jgi:hypothetical protein
VEYRQTRKKIGGFYMADRVYKALVTLGLLPNMPWNWEDPCTSVQRSQAGERGKTTRQRGLKTRQIEMESISQATGGRREDSERGNPKGHQQTTDF